MNDGRKDYFSKWENIAKVKRTEQQQNAWQERVVKKVIRYAEAPLAVAAAKRKAKDTYGDDLLGFTWFHDEYPGFPVRLLGQKLAYTHRATLGDIYGKTRFRSLPWAKEYEAQISLFQLDLAVERAALVFNLPHAKTAFLMVLHNQPASAMTFEDAEERREDHWPRTTFPLKDGTVLVLESLDSFMQTVGVEWVEQC